MGMRWWKNRRGSVMSQQSASDTSSPENTSPEPRLHHTRSWNSLRGSREAQEGWTESESRGWDEMAEPSEWRQTGSTEWSHGGEMVAPQPGHLSRAGSENISQAHRESHKHDEGVRAEEKLLRSASDDVFAKLPRWPGSKKSPKPSPPKKSPKGSAEKAPRAAKKKSESLQSASRTPPRPASRLSHQEGDSPGSDPTAAVAWEQMAANHWRQAVPPQMIRHLADVEKPSVASSQASQLTDFGSTDSSPSAAEGPRRSSFRREERDEGWRTGAGADTEEGGLRSGGGGGKGAGFDGRSLAAVLQDPESPRGVPQNGRRGAGGGGGGGGRGKPRDDDALAPRSSPLGRIQKPHRRRSLEILSDFARGGSRARQQRRSMEVGGRSETLLAAIEKEIAETQAENRERRERLGGGDEGAAAGDPSREGRKEKSLLAVSRWATLGKMSVKSLRSMGVREEGEGGGRGGGGGGGGGGVSSGSGSGEGAPAAAGGTQKAWLGRMFSGRAKHKKSGSVDLSDALEDWALGGEGAAEGWGGDSSGVGGEGGGGGGRGEKKRAGRRRQSLDVSLQKDEFGLDRGAGKGHDAGAVGRGVTDNDLARTRARAGRSTIFSGTVGRARWLLGSGELFPKTDGVDGMRGNEGGLAGGGEEEGGRGMTVVKGRARRRASLEIFRRKDAAKGTAGSEGTEIAAPAPLANRAKGAGAEAEAAGEEGKGVEEGEAKGEGKSAAEAEAAGEGEGEAELLEEWSKGQARGDRAPGVSAKAPWRALKGPEKQEPRRPSMELGQEPWEERAVWAAGPAAAAATTPAIGGEELAAALPLRLSASATWGISDEGVWGPPKGEGAELAVAPTGRGGDGAPAVGFRATGGDSHEDTRGPLDGEGAELAAASTGRGGDLAPVAGLGATWGDSLESAWGPPHREAAELARVPSGRGGDLAPAVKPLAVTVDGGGGRGSRQNSGPLPAGEAQASRGAKQADVRAQEESQTRGRKGGARWFSKGLSRRNSLEVVDGAGMEGEALSASTNQEGRGDRKAERRKGSSRRRSVDNSALVILQAGAHRAPAGSGQRPREGANPSPPSAEGISATATAAATAGGGKKGKRTGIFRTSSIEAVPSMRKTRNSSTASSPLDETKSKPGRKLMRRWSLSALGLKNGSSAERALDQEPEAEPKLPDTGAAAPPPVAAKPRIMFHMVNILRKPRVDIGTDYDILLEEELGRGKYGVIHKCVFRATGQQFACKTVRKEQLVKWQHIEDVRNEVEILETLRSHPHVISLRRSYEDEEAIHMVMDLCEGGDLFERIKTHGKYSEDDAMEVCRTLGEVLLSLRKRGIVHRDLKPENILLCSKENPTAVKVIDFGLATYHKTAEENFEIVGTPSYCAPESLKFGVYGPEADMWSLGVTLYILLSGIPPFCAASIEEIVEIITTDFLDLDEGLWLDISVEARDLIRRMLQVAPAERIKPREVLAHPWLSGQCTPRPAPALNPKPLSPARSPEAIALTAPPPPPPSEAAAGLLRAQTQAILESFLANPEEAPISVT